MSSTLLNNIMPSLADYFNNNRHKPVHLDLPMQVDGKVLLFIIVKHKDIKFKLKET